MLDGVGLTVDFNEEFVAGWVGTQVDACLKKAAHEAASVVMTLQGFSGEVNEGGFSAVGDEFDGVDEVFSSAAELSDTLLGGKVFEFDVFGSGFTLGFEFIELGLTGLQNTEGGSFSFFVTGGDLGFVFPGFEGVGTKEGVGAAELGGGAADLAVEDSSVGINEASGLRKWADSVFDQTIQTIVFPHVFKKVFLIPSGEHGGC